MASVKAPATLDSSVTENSTDPNDWAKTTCLGCGTLLKCRSYLGGCTKACPSCSRHFVVPAKKSASQVRLICKCGTTVRCKASSAGGEGRCPKCQWQFVIPSPQQRVEVAQAFQAFDLDDSGKVDVKEFAILLAALGEYTTDEEAGAALASIDLNSDHEISFEEFFRWWTQPDRVTAESKVGGGYDSARLRSKLIAKSVSHRLAKEVKEIAARREALTEVAVVSKGAMHARGTITAGDITKLQDRSQVVSFEISARCDEKAANEMRAANDIPIPKKDPAPAAVPPTPPAGIVLTLSLQPDASEDDAQGFKGMLEMLLEMAGEALAGIPFSVPQIVYNQEAKTMSFVTISKDEHPMAQMLLSELMHFVKKLPTFSASVKLESNMVPGVASASKVARFTFELTNVEGLVEVINLIASRDEESKDAFKLSTFVRTVNLNIGLADVSDLHELLPDGFPKRERLAEVLREGHSAYDLIQDVLFNNSEFFLEEGNPVSELYFMAQKLFRGLDSVTAVAGDLLVSMKATNFDVFATLPARDAFPTKSAVVDEEGGAEGVEDVE